MAAPTVDQVDFKNNTLHKKKNSGEQDVATLTGKMAVPDIVRVRGHKGKKTTVWRGTVTKDLGGGKYLSEDLQIDYEEVPRAGAKKDDRPGPKDKPKGQEDVSTTVTNGPDESQPVVTSNVATVE